MQRSAVCQFLQLHFPGWKFTCETQLEEQRGTRQLINCDVAAPVRKLSKNSQKILFFKRKCKFRLENRKNRARKCKKSRKFLNFTPR